MPHLGTSLIAAASAWVIIALYGALPSTANGLTAQLTAAISPPALISK